MKISSLKRVDIELLGDDIYLMRQIIKLATNQLNDSEIMFMRGTTIPGQAGYIGSELLEIRDMIERIGEAVEVDVKLTDLTASTCSTTEKSTALIKAE